MSKDAERTLGADIDEEELKDVLAVRHSRPAKESSSDMGQVTEMIKAKMEEMTQAYKAIQGELKSMRQCVDRVSERRDEPPSMSANFKGRGQEHSPSSVCCQHAHINAMDVQCQGQGHHGGGW